MVITMLAWCQTEKEEGGGILEKYFRLVAVLQPQVSSSLEATLNYLARPMRRMEKPALFLDLLLHSDKIRLDKGRYPSLNITLTNKHPLGGAMRQE